MLFDLVTRPSDLVTGSFNLVTRSFDLVTGQLRFKTGRKVGTSRLCVEMPPKLTKKDSLALFAWLEPSQAFFIQMTRNVPKVILLITIVEEYKPSGRFIWEAVFSLLYFSKNAILN